MVGCRGCRWWLLPGEQWRPRWSSSGQRLEPLLSLRQRRGWEGMWSHARSQLWLLLHGQLWLLLHGQLWRQLSGLRRPRLRQRILQRCCSLCCCTRHLQCLQRLPRGNFYDRPMLRILRHWRQLRSEPLLRQLWRLQPWRLRPPQRWRAGKPRHCPLCMLLLQQRGHAADAGHGSSARCLGRQHDSARCKRQRGWSLVRHRLKGRRSCGRHGRGRCRRQGRRGSKGSRGLRSRLASRADLSCQLACLLQGGHSSRQRRHGRRWLRLCSRFRRQGSGRRRLAGWHGWCCCCRCRRLRRSLR